MQRVNCEICASDRFVDNHHYDCLEGKLSPETVPLCRRCHRTYHDRGVDYFDDEYLDKAIAMENKRREIYYANRDVLGTRPQPPLKKEDIVRSNYWNKTHGLPERREGKGSRPATAIFRFHLPHGEPLCGQQWVDEHLHDLLDWIPRIEIIHPNFKVTMEVDSSKKLKDAVKILRGLKGMQ